jgi:vacuolar-type H+-ATPase subunit C/Vma6
LRYLDYDIEDDSFYLFTSAELTARDTEFLDRSKIDRMLRSQNLDELIKLLRDTVYSAYTEELAKSGNFEEIMSVEYKKIADFLLKNLRRSHQFAGEILFFDEIVHNLKTVIKSIILDKDMDKLFIPLYYSYRELKDAVTKSDYKNPGREVSRTLQFAVEKMAKEKDSRVLEFEMEKFYFKEIFNSVQTFNSKLIKDYVKHLIDITNIKNIYRSKYLKQDLSMDYFLYDNGFLSVEFLAGFMKENIDVLQKKLEQTYYADIVARGASDLYSKGTFSTFEKEEVTFFFDFLSPLKYTVSNMEKIFQFFLKKKFELKYLNIIFTGFLYGIDIEKVKSKIVV